MTNDYLTEREKRKNIDIIFYNYLFGVEFGLIEMTILLIVFIQYSNNVILDIFILILIFIGFIIFGIAIVSPLKLERFRKFMMYIGNKIFGIILKILLTIFYYLMIFPTSIFMKSRERKLQGNSNYKIANDKMYTNNNGIKIIFKFFNKESLYMLPFILVCIILSLFFIFMNSSVIAPFIYTLF